MSRQDGEIYSIVQVYSGDGRKRALKYLSTVAENPDRVGRRW